MFRLRSSHQSFTFIIYGFYFSGGVDVSRTLLATTMEREHSLTYNLLTQLTGDLEYHGMTAVSHI